MPGFSSAFATIAASGQLLIVGGLMRVDGSGGVYSYHSTSIRLQFDRATTIRRPTLRP